MAFAFMYSMGLWKTHFAIGIKASGLSLTKPNRFCQHDTTHNFAHSPLGVALLPLDIFLDCAHGMVPHDVVYELGKQ